MSQAFDDIDFPAPWPVREVPPEFAYQSRWDSPDEPFGVANPISERNLHSDRYMERVLADVPGFLLRYLNFPNDDYQPKHIYTALGVMFKGGRWVFLWATDHAKSMTGTFFFPILSLAADPNAAHLIMGANINDSRSQLQRVARELETNQQLITDYPWLAKPKRPKGGGSGGLAWSRTEITVAGRERNNRNPSIYACTVSQSDVRGRRGKLIMDDIEGEEARHSASKRKQLYDFVQLEAVTCLEDTHDTPRPLVCAMGTPFDVDSIYGKLADGDWQVIKIPAYTMPWSEVTQYAFMKLADGTQSNRQTPWQERAALLPDKLFTWPRKRLKVTENDPMFGNQMDKTHFSIRYLLDPAAGDPLRLSYREIRRLVAGAGFDDQGSWITVISLDPAAGVDADYAGIAAVRIRWPKEQALPDLQVMEAHRFEGGIIEQVDLCSDLCWKPEYIEQDGTYKGRPCRLVYESNSQQGGQYRNVFGHRRPEIRLVPIYTSGSAKNDTDLGLTVIKTLVKQQKLHVPQSQLESDGIQTLLREIRDLGSDREHDHIACSIWFVVRWIFTQIRQMNAQPDSAPHGQPRFGSRTSPFFRPRHPAGTGWRR